MNTTKFRGSLEECLKHLGDHDKDFVIRHKLSDFTGANYESVRRWFRAGKSATRPVGIYALKTVHFLELFGYTVTNFPSTQKGIHHFAQCVVFDIIKIEDAEKIVGLANRQQLYSLLLGKIGTSKERRIKMEKYADIHSEDLRSYIGLHKQDLGITEESERSIHTELPKVSDVPAIGPKPIIESLGYALRAILPLAQAVASDSFSAEEREETRQIAGRSTVLHLSNALIKLSGERARQSSIERQSRTL